MLGRPKIPIVPPTAFRFSMTVRVMKMKVNPTMTTAKVGASPMNKDTSQPMIPPRAKPARRAHAKGTFSVMTSHAAAYPEMAMLATVMK